MIQNYVKSKYITTAITHKYQLDPDSKFFKNLLSLYQKIHENCFQYFSCKN